MAITCQQTEYNFAPEGYEVPEMIEAQLKAIHTAAYNDSRKLSNDEWIADRRGGIGGSDVAALMGDSPFATNWDLFMDKTGLAKRDMSGNWFRLAYGHATEPITAELFARKFQAIIVNETGMFQHPQYPFMRANLDRLAILPNDELVILEIKSTNAFGKTAWEKSPPIYYEWQGRHYLAVINGILRKAGLPEIRRVYYGALYGNTEEDVLFRKVNLDEGIEAAMISAERIFWEENVIPQALPGFNGTGKKLAELCMSRRIELVGLLDVPAVESTDGIPVLGEVAQAIYTEIEEKAQKVSTLKKQIDSISEEADELKASLISMMDGKDSVRLPNGITATITSRTTRSTNYSELQELFPKAYELCVKEGASAPSLKFKKPTKKELARIAAEAAAMSTG